MTPSTMGMMCAANGGDLVGFYPDNAMEQVFATEPGRKNGACINYARGPTLAILLITMCFNSGYHVAKTTIFLANCLNTAWIKRVLKLIWKPALPTLHEK